MQMNDPSAFLTSEYALLGACLSTPALWEKVLTRLRLTDFTDPLGSSVFQTAQRLEQRRQIADAPTLAEHGADRKFLFELLEVACMPSAVEQHIQLLYQRRQRETLRQVGQELIDRCQTAVVTRSRRRMQRTAGRR